jgi:hypothetical protein
VGLAFNSYNLLANWAVQCDPLSPPLPPRMRDTAAAGAAIKCASGRMSISSCNACAAMGHGTPPPPPPPHTRTCRRLKQNLLRFLYLLNVLPWAMARHGPWPVDHPTTMHHARSHLLTRSPLEQYLLRFNCCRQETASCRRRKTAHRSSFFALRRLAEWRRSRSCSTRCY